MANEELDLDSICSSLLHEGFIPTPWEADPGEVHPNNTHSRDEIVYLLKGQMELTLNGKSHLLRAGDRTLIPAGTCHDLRVIGNEGVEFVSAIRSNE
jgi:quercetin dioxygenase-like cupin family protein